MPGALRLFEPAFRFVFHVGAVARRIIAPAMKPAGDGFHIATPAGGQNCAAMCACVYERTQRTIFLADNKNRLLSNVSRVVIAKIRNLAFVTKIHPDMTEDALHLGHEYLRLRINATINAKHTVVEPIVNER